MKVGIIISIIVIILFVPTDVFADQIPQWVKTNAEWWTSNEINDDVFLAGIEYLLNEKIIIVSIINSSVSEKTDQIPQWVKTNTEEWSSNEINDDVFLAGIEYLIKIGIINIESKNNCEKDLEKISTDETKIKEICNNFKSNKNSELIPFDIKIDYNTKGFRGDNFPVKKIQDEFRIIAVGGSTMFGGQNSSDQTTIPGILQQMINYNNPDLKIRVINAGISGATSFTELELIKNKLIDYEPDLIIVYDGWNDLRSNYSSENVLKNWNEMCQLSQENDFELMIFLQPIAGFGDKVLTEQEKINSLTGEDSLGFQLIQVKTLYNGILSKKLLSLDENCHGSNIHNAYDGISGPIYWDQGHVLDVGIFIIADKFLEKLNKNYPNIFDYDNKFIKITSKYNHPAINELVFLELNINIDYSKVNFQNTLNLEEQKKGNYFQLKNKLGIENILVGKDLRNVDLKKINLDGKDLTGANLSGQDLRNIDLKNTIIRDANLSYTNLEGKDFLGVDIRGIDFSYANLKNSDFTDSKISKMIQLPPFVPKECEQTHKKIDASSFDENTLYSLDLICGIKELFEKSFTVTDFSNADLTNAKFQEQNLVFVNFSNADLTNAKFNRVNILGSSYNSAILDQVKFSQVLLLHNDFKKVEMKKFEIGDSWLQNISFKNSNMQEGSINSSVLFNVSFENVDLDKTIMDNEYGKTNFECKNNPICIK